MRHGGAIARPYRIVDEQGFSVTPATVREGAQSPARTRRGEEQTRTVAQGENVAVRAVLFDYSGTLFRLEEDERWFTGMEAGDREIDGHVQAELMRRLTAPDRSLRRHDTRGLRDLGQPRPGAAPPPRGVPACAARIRSGRPPRRVALQPRRRPGELDALPGHRRCAERPCPGRHQDRGRVQHRVRPAARIRSIGALDGVDEFVLSFEVGTVKPNPEIFQTALARLGVPAADAVMIGDSDEADGAARDAGLRVRARRSAADWRSDPTAWSGADRLRASRCSVGCHAGSRMATLVAQARSTRSSCDVSHRTSASAVTRPVVLTVAGRKSGKPRSTPITPIGLGRQPLRRRGVPWRGLGEQRPGRGRGDAAAWPAPERIRMVELSPTRPAAAAAVSGRGADRCEPHEKAGLVRTRLPEEFEALAGTSARCSDSNQCA